MLPRILLVVGLLSIAGGGFLLLSSSPRAESERVANLLAVQPKAVRELPSSTELLLEGHLLAREALGPEGFVVYEEQRFLRTETEGASKGREQWQTLTVPRPLIGVELSHAEVPICNRDYAIASPPHSWQSDVVPTSRDFFHSTLRLRGFKSGDELTVDGRVVGSQSNGTRCVEAKAIFGGGPRAYADSVRQGVLVFKVVGTIFAALGGGLLATGWWLRRRFAPRQSRAGR